MSANLSAIFYLVSGVLFILALRGLSSPETSRQGNFFGILGMVIAITVTFLSVGNFSSGLIYVLIFLLVGGLIGAFIAYKIPMTAMPELVAGFHSLVGLSAVFVAISAFLNPEAFNLGSVGAIKLASLIEMSIGAAVGAITFSGSIIAFLKLQGIMSGSPITFKGQHFLNALLLISILILTYLLCSSQSSNFFWILIAVSFLIGFLLIIPIGGADMPVVISMLNSYSGWAAAGIGFTLENTALIITGALVGSSGAILSYIMCKGMNRSFFNVILGGFGATEQSVSTGNKEQRPVKSGNAEDAAFLMKNASSVIIVPGYGMAVAQAQHALREMVDTLKKNDIKVTYAIHPVAGRMPGHMNVLLAEANVPYDEVFELEEINNDFANADVAFVIGANDVTNPVAKTDPQSPIYGMPVLDVEKCKSVLFVKRSLSPGYAGIDNELFYKDNTLMLFADAKKMTEDITKKFIKLMTTKIFCDIAELDLIKKFNKKKIVKGFTTNPSLMRKAGAKDYKSYSKKILKICNNKPVSLEVFADEYKEMKKQALQINTWGKNVYVKVPVANSKGIFMGKIIKELNNLDIKLNITAIYSAKQTEKILKLINKKTKVIISIFAGRAGDTGKDPVPEFKKSISIAKKFKNVEILWASVREPYNYLQAKQLGCHIITIPPTTIEKIENFGKTFDQLTKETVKAFLVDSKKSRFKI